MKQFGASRFLRFGALGFRDSGLGLEGSGLPPSSASPFCKWQLGSPRPRLAGGLTGLQRGRNMPKRPFGSVARAPGTSCGKSQGVEQFGARVDSSTHKGWPERPPEISRDCARFYISHQSPASAEPPSPSHVAHSKWQIAHLHHSMQFNVRWRMILAKGSQT